MKRTCMLGGCLLLVVLLWPSVGLQAQTTAGPSYCDELCLTITYEGHAIGYSCVTNSDYGQGHHCYATTTECDVRTEGCESAPTELLSEGTLVGIARVCRDKVEVVPAEDWVAAYSSSELKRVTYQDLLSGLPKLGGVL